MAYRLGVDVGGTFTDLFLVNDEDDLQFRVKTPTTPADPSDCTVDAKLVPTCNVLWGSAAGGFSDTPRDQALREWEAKSGRTASIYHTYHKGDEMFPTKAEIAMANEAGKPRILFTNWKVGYGTKWGKVANGDMDARIDKLSNYIKANYTAQFFMAIHHEPENDVSTTAGSGMTAKDYAAMYRDFAGHDPQVGPMLEAKGLVGGK